MTSVHTPFIILIAISILLSTSKIFKYPNYCVWQFIMQSHIKLDVSGFTINISRFYPRNTKKQSNHRTIRIEPYKTLVNGNRYTHWAEKKFHSALLTRNADNGNFTGWWALEWRHCAHASRLSLLRHGSEFINKRQLQWGSR